MDRSKRLADALKDLAETISHHSMGGFFHFAKENELSPSQMGTLMRLSHVGRLGVTHIGGDMSMTGAAASQMIDRLVQQGFVERSEDPEDRRSKRIDLTALGERTVRECRTARGRWLTVLAAKMSAKEAELVIEALGILSAKIKDLEASAPHRPFGAAKENNPR